MAAAASVLSQAVVPRELDANRNCLSKEDVGEEWTAASASVSFSSGSSVMPQKSDTKSLVAAKNSKGLFVSPKGLLGPVPSTSRKPSERFHLGDQVMGGPMLPPPRLPPFVPPPSPVSGPFLPPPPGWNPFRSHSVPPPTWGPFTRVPNSLTMQPPPF